MLHVTVKDMRIQLTGEGGTKGGVFDETFNDTIPNFAVGYHRPGLITVIRSYFHLGKYA